MSQHLMYHIVGEIRGGGGVKTVYTPKLVRTVTTAHSRLQTSPSSWINTFTPHTTLSA